MKVGDFEIKCISCGSENVSILEYHNEDDDWVVFVCQDCKNKAEI